MQRQATYRSLEALQQRKEQIQKAIRNDNSEIVKKWKSLFHTRKASHKKGFSMSSLISTSAGVFDGLILAWKLYGKFRRR